MTQQHRMRKHLRVFTAIAAGLCWAGALPAQVTQTDYNSLTGTQFLSFAGVTGGAAPGTNYDGLLYVNGVGFGERFDGQSVTPSGDFDVVSGTPLPGLTLLPGSAGQNLTVFTSPAGPVLSGNGPLGFPTANAIGEGAVSLLFSSNQSEFGFRLTGGSGGTATVGFHRVDGSLIQSFVLGNQPLIAAFGFTRDAGIADIRGVSIWNADVTGIGLAQFRFNAASVPEPSTWAMMLGGFAIMGIALRRRRGSAGPTIRPQLS